MILLSLFLHACEGGQRTALGGAPVQAEVGSAFPAFIGHSLQGRTIDNSYFKDKITLVSAWRLGCRWSMLEIPEYNQLLTNINDPRFQIISMAPQTRDEMETFYSEDITTKIGKSRMEMEAEIPRYDVLPMCSMKRLAADDPVGAQCDALQSLLGVEVFPVTFLVGPDGAIRHRHDGLIVDPETYEPDISLFKQDLDSLLRVL